MKLNTHGLIGILAIVGMMGVAYLKHWNINWMYFGVAIITYSIVVLFITLTGKDEYFYPTLFLVGCHISLVLLAISLILDISGPWETIGAFAICVSVGLAIPRLLLWKERNEKLTLNIHGLFGILVLLVIFSIRPLTAKLPWVYFAAAIIMYSLPFATWVWSAWYDSEHGEDKPYDSTSIRIIWGWHLVLVFLTGGMLIDLRQVSLPFELVYTVIFVTSIAAGLAIPFLLLRDRK